MVRGRIIVLAATGKEWNGGLLVYACQGAADSNKRVLSRRAPLECPSISKLVSYVEEL